MQPIMPSGTCRHMALLGIEPKSSEGCISAILSVSPPCRDDGEKRKKEEKKKYCTQKPKQFFALIYTYNTDMGNVEIKIWAAIWTAH